MAEKQMTKPQITSPEFWKALADDQSRSSANQKCMTAECWDKAAEGYDDLDACHDYMVQVNGVIKILKETGILSSHCHMIDIACGTGTYAVRMAPFCKKVTCVDISGRMLEKLRQKKEKAGIENIELIQTDWNSFSPKRRFDLVFCSMSPLMKDMNNIDRFIECSSRYLAFVTWAGIRENMVLSELGMKILNRKPGKHLSDMNILFNYLYSLGYAPELHFFRGCWQKKRSVEKQIKNIIWRLEMYRPLDQKEKEYVASYVKKRASTDGMMTITTRVRTALMIIDKEAETFTCP